MTMRPLTERERDFLGFGEKHGRPGESLDYSDNGDGTFSVTHTWFREWIGDDASTVTEHDRQVTHSLDERETCEDCKRWEPHIT